MALTVVLLHGIGSSATSWEPQRARLGGAFHLVTPDLRGYGAAPDPVGEPRLDAVVDDLVALIARERPPVHVAGVSFGALAGIALAYRHPELVRSLVLADATLGRAMLAPPERERWLAWRLELAAGIAEKSTERAREIAAPGASDAVVAAIAAAMRRARPAGYAYVAACIAATDATPWLGALAVPTLVVCGSEDAVVGAALSRRIAELIPNARYAEIAGAGHAPHVEQPDAFAQLVRDFLSAVPA